MPISVHVHRAAGIRLVVYAGAVTSHDMAALARSCFDPAVFDPAHKSFILFTRDVNMFEIEISDFVDLDGAISEAMEDRGQTAALRDAVVAERPSVRADLALWRETTTAAPNYTYEFEMFEDMSAAVAWHGLTPDWADRIASRRDFETALPARQPA